MYIFNLLHIIYHTQVHTHIPGASLPGDIIYIMNVWLTYYMPDKNKFTDTVPFDELKKFESLITVKELVAKFDQPEFHKTIEHSFLQSFLNHHPEYNFSNCMVLSGSARTALSILGFECKINEVVTTDLSWTYEHCFPKVVTIPFDKDLNISADDIIRILKNKTENNRRLGI